jgi:hypothetical protein
MIAYILHVTVITTVCFLFYKLLLQKETFYRLNRWTLMGCLAVSFGLPLLPVPQGWSWRYAWQEENRQSAATTGSRTGETTAERRTSGTATEGGTSGAAVDDALLSSDLLYTETTVRQHARQQATLPRKAVKRKQRPLKMTTPAEQTETAAKVNGAFGPGTPGTGTGSQSQGAFGQGTVSQGSPGTGTMSQGNSGTGAVAQGSSGTGAVAQGSSVAPTPSMGTGAKWFSAQTLLMILQWMFYAYVFGVLLFGASFLLQLAVLLYQSYARPVIRDGRFRIVETNGNRAPCSFGNTIFINPANYDWDTYNQILIHEKIHVSGRHTLDILLAETALVFQWFNPFAWLYRREVENNLEFLTDASVLRHQEVERSAYQLSLLRVCAPHLPFSITNNYNQSLLKRRIVMMNSKSSSTHTIWKYFFLIPLLTGLVCALNKPAALGAATGDRKTTGDAGGPISGAPYPFLNAGSGLPALWTALFSPVADTSVKPSSSGAKASKTKDSADGNGNEWRLRSDDNEWPLHGDFDVPAGAVLVVPKIHVDPAPVSMDFQTSTQPNVYIDKQAMIDRMNIDLMDQQAIAAKVDVIAGKSLFENPKLKLDLEKSQVKMNFVAIPDVKIDMKMMYPSDTDMMEGSWFATSEGDSSLDFELRSGYEDHNWNSNFYVRKVEINPFPGQGNVEFKLVRDAGTMTFKGQFDGDEGFGHFHYVANPTYFSDLKRMGVEMDEDRPTTGFFMLNVKKDYVDMVVHNGYPHISQHDLMSFAAMHINKDFIQAWRGSGVLDDDNPHELISLKAMKIDRAFVDDIKAAGYDHLSLHDLMSLKAQHIDGAYIRSLGRGKDNEPIPVHELVSYKAMHIDSGYLAALRKLGYDDLARNEVTSLYAMHVSPEYIKGLQDLGYKDIPVHELTSLMAREVTPEYIKSFRDIGYTDLDLKEIGNLKALRITPDYVKGFVDLGYKDISWRDLTNLKARDITPEYIKSFRDIGLKDIDLRQLGGFKALGITAEFIKGFHDLGYDDLSAGQLNALKNMGVTPDFVKSFNKLGYDHIPVNTLISLKNSGVDADYVSKMKEKGFDSKDLEKYIRLKRDFN